MNKITAVGLLANGECDAIMHGTSEFILNGEDIVNKRSKKALDMKKMFEEGWDTKLLPRWDDAMSDGQESPTLCVLENDGSVIIILSKTEDGDYITSYGEIYDKETYGQLRPATRDEALALVADIKDTPQPRAKPKAKPKAEDVAKPVSEPEVVETIPKAVSSEDFVQEMLHEKHKPAVIKGETDISQTGEKFGIDLGAPGGDTGVTMEIDLGEELPATQDHPDAHPVAEGIDLVDTTTPFDIDPEDTIPFEVETPKQQEACPPTKSENTVSPKEGTTDIKRKFVSLGLDPSFWDDFKGKQEAAGVDLNTVVLKGDGELGSMVITYLEQRAKATPSEPANAGQLTPAEIIDRLEPLLDFGLDEEDAVEFYNFFKLDKFSLQDVVSNATDEEVTDKVQEFYDARA